MKAALVHDYLTQRGGAERVVLSFCRAVPGAPVYTSLYEPAATFPEFADETVIPMAMNRIGLLRRNHRLGFPLYAPAFSRLLIDADVVLCSSSGWAHGVRATGRKVVYCYTPARWLYQTATYVGRRYLAGALGPALSVLTAWDLRVAHTASTYLTSSRAVQSRIRELYGIDSEVVAPPHTIGAHGPQVPVDGVEPGFFLCVSRLLPYKNVDAVISAFDSLRHLRLVIVGGGPEEAALRKNAPSNVTFAGTIGDKQLRWLYASAAGVIAAAFEDYGLTPVEAAAFGTPSAVLRWGGFLDTVVDGETGVFFEEPEPALIASAVLRLVAAPPGHDVLVRHADQFSEEAFIARIRAVVG